VGTFRLLLSTAVWVTFCDTVQLMHTAILSYTEEGLSHSGILSFHRGVVTYRSCFTAATVLAVAGAAACGSLVELILQPIVVIRECPMPRGKDDSQVNVVCMFESVKLDTGNRSSLDRRPYRFSATRFRYTPQRSGTQTFSIHTVRLG
jgi:hypothetical protein